MKKVNHDQKWRCFKKKRWDVPTVSGRLLLLFTRQRALAASARAPSDAQLLEIHIYSTCNSGLHMQEFILHIRVLYYPFVPVDQFGASANYEEYHTLTSNYIEILELSRK
jgi:hypothetical protein